MYQTYKNRADPSMTDDSATERDTVERLAEGFMASYRAGERKSIDEYARQFPELADQLRELLAALVVLERNAPHRDAIGQASEVSNRAEAPREIGDFVIVREIARGGMGVVYEAVQQSLGRHVALKVLSTPELINPVHLERFRFEARAAARLHHTNIVPVFGVGEHYGLHYYAMQFIQGHSLDLVISALRMLRGTSQPDHTPPDGDAFTFAAAKGMLTGQFRVGANQVIDPPPTANSNATPFGLTTEQPPKAPPTVTDVSLSENSKPASSHSGREFYRSVARIGLQVAEALAYAHSEGVLHRDIKPSNLLLDAKGNVWITDFGLAKAEGTDGLTHTGDFVGTLRYMAPERLDGSSDRRSDLYSLGATLYELVTLQPFLKTGSSGQLIERIRNESPSAPSKHDRSIPRDLETIVLKSLAKEPTSRYRTAAAMADDLRRFLKGEPIHARPIGRVERAWRWCRRNPAVAGLSAGVIFSLAALLLFLAIYAARERARALDLQQSLARQYLRRGQLLCEQGDLAHGLHWLARSLAEAPRQSVALRDVIRENLASWSEQWAVPRAILEHPATLNNAIALSPDGKRAAVGGYRGMVQFWSVETGEPLPLVRRHSSDVSRVAFSPDGTRVVSACVDHTAQLWDPATGAPVGDPLRHDDKVWDAVFSPDGKLVATASSDKTVRLWDCLTGKPVGSPIRHEDAVSHVMFSADGSRLLTAYNRSGIAQVWAVPINAPPIATIRYQAGFIDVALSPDGKVGVMGSDDNSARLWNADNGHFIGGAMHHADAVNCVAFSPDGKLVLTGSADGTARIWDTETAEPTGIVLNHQGAVRDVQFSVDGKWILTGSADGTGRLWDAQTGRLLGVPLRHAPGDNVTVVALAGSTVMTATNGSVAALWTVEPEISEGILPPRAVLGPTLAYSRRGDRILFADEREGSAVTWWSPGTDELYESNLWNRDSYLWAIALSADGRRVACGGLGEITAQIWSLENGEHLLFNLPHPDQVRAVAFSPDAKLVATAGFDGTARLWSVDSGQQFGPPLPHATMVEDVGFSPDGKLLVTACDDGAARIWSVETGRQVGLELRHRDSVLGATFSPDGKLVATGSRDNTVRFWDVASGQAVGSPLEQPGWVEDVCFSPDGNRIATASLEGRVRQWSVETGELLGPPRDCGEWAFEVAYSPDGTSLAVAGWPGGARLWTVPSRLDSNITPEEAELRIQVLTWMEMDANGVLGRLDRATWQARRAQLAKATDH
jgi:WD40 repeat protein/serine/threonine protein kinase